MVDDVMLSSKSAEFGTPDDFLTGLSKLVGRFDTDPCARLARYAKAPRFYSPVDTPGTSGVDGLAHNWPGHTFMNPPWRKANKKKGILPIRIDWWIEKAIAESRKSHSERVTMLIPSRTDTKWFLRAYQQASLVMFVHGRLSYLTLGEGDDGQAVATDPAMFPSVVFVMDKAIRTQSVGLIDARGKVLV